MEVLQKLEIIFILLAWASGIFAWYFGYKVYAATRGRSRFYVYFFFGGLSVGMLLVLRIFGMLNFYEIESWLVAYDFFLMLSAVLMMLGFRGMYNSLQE
ncbi:MAG: hypothetical protein ACE5HH_00480 [Candidatus Hydrothermarchaeales archaeon]